MFHSLLISVLVNKVSVLILFNTLCILKKINVSFIVHFCLGKYSFSLDTFWTKLAFCKKIMPHLSFISVLVNIVSVFFNTGRMNFLCILKKFSCSPVVTTDHCPVSWGCRIHWLHLCRGVRPPHNECPGYDTKQSDGEVPAGLELWGMRGTPSLPSLPGPLWPGVVAPDRALSMG